MSMWTWLLSLSLTHLLSLSVIILLKHASLTNEDYKNTTLLPLKARLMCNKARFMRKIISGKAPAYLLEKMSINHYSRNCSRKFNVPTLRLDLS